MIKIRIVATGEIVEVKPNDAFGMIERGEAVTLDVVKKQKQELKQSTRMMTAKRKNFYRTK